MPQRLPFINKLLTKLERVEKKAVEGYLVDLARENDQYAAVLDRLPVGVVLLRDEQEAFYLNNQARTWLGIHGLDTDESLHLVRSVKDDAANQAFSELLRDIRSQDAVDFHMLEPREMDLRALLYPLNEEDYPAKAVLFLQNITAEKKQETDKQRVKRNESLVRLASGVAHEIGNPLNGINIHLELLQQGAESLSKDKREKFLKTISVLKEETSRLDRIIRSFLKATRKPPLRFRLDDLNEVIEETAAFFEPELQSRGIGLQFRRGQGLPLFLMDRERLREVFVNLIKNAMEAMPDGGVLQIMISHKGSVAMVRVKDEGEGINPEDIAHIFEAYYTTKEKGSGLGLMMVHDAIVEHGGRIEVDSREGKGTVFTILLPIREPKLQLPQSGF